MFSEEISWFEYNELTEEAKDTAHSDYVSYSFGQQDGDCSLTLINMGEEISVIISDAGLIEIAPLLFDDYGYPGSKVWITDGEIDHFDVWSEVNETDDDVFELSPYAGSLMIKLEPKFDPYFNNAITSWNQSCDEYYALLATYSSRTYSYDEIATVVAEIESLIEEAIASLKEDFCSALEYCSDEMCSLDYFETEIAPYRVFSADGNDYDWK